MCVCLRVRVCVCMFNICIYVGMYNKLYLQLNNQQSFDTP